MRGRKTIRIGKMPEKVEYFWMGAGQQLSVFAPFQIINRRIGIYLVNKFPLINPVAPLVAFD